MIDIRKLWGCILSHVDSSFYAGHRERLRQKFLDDKLADYELLESLLGYVIPRRDVRPLARGLIHRFGGIHDVFMATLDDLMQFPGIGRNTAIFLKMVHKLMILEYRHSITDMPVFHNRKIVLNYCRTQLSCKDVEELHVLYLDDSYRLIQDDLHTTGTIDMSMVYRREIAKKALNLNSRNIVLIHNHPISGKPFSMTDIRMTQDLEEFLKPLGISIYDHFVVSDGIVYSARDMNLFKEPLDQNKLATSQI